MAIEALKDQTIIIFVDGSNLYKSPQIVQDAIASKEAIGPTPIIAVFDPKVEEKIGVVNYYSMKNADGFKDVRAALMVRYGSDEEPKPLTHYEPEAWGDTRGRSMRAAYVNSTDTEVTFRLANNTTTTIAISKLSDESQKRVAELAAAAK